MIKENKKSIKNLINLKFILVKNPIGEVFQRIKYQNPPIPFKLITINPNEVNYLTIPRFEYTYYPYYTYIQGGDWDRRIRNKRIDFLFESQGNSYDYPRAERFSLKRYLLPFEHYTFYNSSKAHFQDGVPWEDTRIYEFFIDKIEEGITITRFETEEKVIKQLSYFDSLYNKIKRKWL